MYVSIYENCSNPKVYADVAVDDVIDYIKVNKTVNTVRRYKNLSCYSKKKLSLPSVTWGARFNPIRHSSNVVQESGFIYFDIDNYTDKKFISEIPETYAVWTSISGKGLGGLIRSNCDKNSYSETYKEFGRKYNLPLDHTSDITRLNIISYDTDIFVNKQAKVFEKIEREKQNYEVIAFDNIDSEACELAYNSTLKKGLKYNRGSRYFFVSSYCFLTNIFGIDLEKALHFLYNKNIYSEYDFDLELTAYNVYKYSKDKFKTAKVNNMVNDLYRA